MVSRLMRRRSALLPLLCIFAALPAQGKVGEQVRAEEVEVLDLGRRELNAYAALCEQNGFPRRARELRFEVLGEYDADDADARRALGFRRHGTVWQLDPDFDYAPADEPAPAAAKNLTRRFEAVCRKLGQAHVKAGEQLAAAGHDDRAEYHFRRALRFLPDDPRVIAVAGLQQYEGVAGSAVDLEILRRSRLMDRAITGLVRQDFEVEQLDGAHPVLGKLDGPFTGWRTENYTVWGDHDAAVLQQAAMWAERALAFCDEAFSGKLRPAAASRSRRTFVFLREKSTWVRLLETNVTTVGRDHAAFLAENANAGMIGELHTSGFSDVEVVYDLAVRWVAHDYTAFRSDALRAGIGHAIVGMFFGRNLVFAVAEQQQQRTVASRTEQKLLLPDIDSWMQLATEIAWSRTSTKAARLPLLEASSFPTDGRIKAWSFCDYLLRRDPLLLEHLDRTVPKAKTEREVLDGFAERAHRPLEGIEEGWRRFWTEDSAIKRAILDRSTPLEATSRDAPKWLEAFNRARVSLGRRPVGWSSQLSIDCKQHGDYLVRNKDQRGPAAEHTQLPGRPGYSNAGRTFAQTAVVWTGRDPKKAIAQWLSIPGYRDAILNRNIDVVGLWAGRGVMVLDARRGRRPSDIAFNITYPAPGDGGRSREPVERSVDVALLGPEVERLLAQNGRDGQRTIGFPLSAHLYFGVVGAVRCEVKRGAEPVEGWLVRGSGSNGRTSAEGLWVFYPAEPLPRGADITATWSWNGGGAEVTFTAR